MLGVVLVLLGFLVLLGYVQIPWLNIRSTELLVVAGHSITFFEVLVLIFLIWAITLLPRFFKESASVLLILWLMALFGIIAITGLKELILIALVVGFLIYLFRGSKKSK